MAKRKAIMVEEGTTNLIQNSSFENTIGSEWSVIQDVSLSRVSTSSKFGSYSAQVVATEDNSWGGIYQKYSVALGNKYTISVWVRALDTNSVGKNARVAFIGYNSSNAVTTDIYYNFLTLPSDWTLYTLSVTVADSDTTQGIFRFQLNNTVTGCGAFVDGFQVEAKPYATSFIDGTRAVETLTIPTAGVLNKGNWTKDFVFIPTTTQVVANKIGYLWDCYIDENNYYALKVGADGKPYLEIKSNGTVYQTATTSVPVLAVNTPYSFTVRGNGSLMALFINGSKVSEVSYAEPVGDLPANMFIGSDHNGANHANGLIADLRISNRALTDDEILARYKEVMG